MLLLVYVSYVQNDFFFFLFLIVLPYLITVFANNQQGPKKYLLTTKLQTAAVYVNNKLFSSSISPIF